MSNKKHQNDFLDPNNDEPMYGIYQLKNESHLRDYIFTRYETLEESGRKVKRQNYDLVYVTPHDGQSLDDIYMRFNLDHPDDFKGHSLSVSDVIVLKHDSGQYTTHYVDYFGFKPIPNFMTESTRPPRKKSDMEM